MFLWNWVKCSYIFNGHNSLCAVCYLVCCPLTSPYLFLSTDKLWKQDVQSESWMWARISRVTTVCQICDKDKLEWRAHLQRCGWHACGDCTGQVAELLQYPDGAAGAAKAHDMQGKHEASSATWGPDLHQLSPCYFCLHLFLLFLPQFFCFAFTPLSPFCAMWHSTSFRHLGWARTHTKLMT